jgi:hypothetical protein
MTADRIPAKVFTGFCDDEGHSALDDRKAFVAYIAEHFKGEEFELTIQKRTRQRSVRQLRWLWGVALPLIAEHCGYDKHEHERLHYDLLAVRFGTVAVVPLVEGASPRIVPTKTTSDLNTKDMSDYMEWLVRYAAEKFDTVIPLPDERDMAKAS